MDSRDRHVRFDDNGVAIRSRHIRFDGDERYSAVERRAINEAVNGNGSRKRKVNAETWQRNVKSRQYNVGESRKYAGVERQRTPQGMCDPQVCRAQCGYLFTPEQQAAVCDLFWTLQSTKAKRHSFLDRRVRPSQGMTPFDYYLPIIGGGEHKVCQTMFLRSLDISKSMVKTAKAKYTVEGFDIPVTPETRGGSNRLPPAVFRRVVNHIDTFPRVGSHYVPDRTKRQYLDERLSVAKMHSLYLEGCDEENSVKYERYLKIFNEEFNIGFHKPSQDRCAICVHYEALSAVQRTTEKVRQYQLHRAQINSIRQFKRECAQKALQMNTFRAVCFDLEQTITLPKSNVGDSYYKRKLNLYNLTVFELGHNIAHNYLWDQTAMDRGGAEIGTAVSRWLEQADSDGVNEVELFSDSTGGQNRNRIFSTMLIHLLSRSQNIKKITHRLFVVGHSQMEADTVHGNIQRALDRRIEADKGVFVPHDVARVIRSCTGSDYRTTILSHTDKRQYKRLMEEMVGPLSEQGFAGMMKKWLFCYRKDERGDIKVHWAGSPTAPEEQWSEVRWLKARTAPRAMPWPLEIGGEPIPLPWETYEDLLYMARVLVFPPRKMQYVEDLPHVPKQSSRSRGRPAADGASTSAAP